LPDRHFDIVHQLDQDLGDERAFLVVWAALTFHEQVGDVLHQRLAPEPRFVAGKLQQSLLQLLPLCRHGDGAFRASAGVRITLLFYSKFHTRRRSRSAFGE
jgi:hypothetical protein